MDNKEPASQNSAKEDEIEFTDKKMDSYQPMLHQSKSGRKKLITAAVIVVIVLLGGWVVKSFVGESSKSGEQTGSQPIPTQFSTPTPKPQLIKSEWSFEVLNGSGVRGAAKKLADQLKDLGYQVVKVANADRDDYAKTQILVTGNLQDKIDLVVADVKDVVKIASVAGELKDSTASARIIIGKE